MGGGCHGNTNITYGWSRCPILPQMELQRRSRMDRIPRFPAV